MPGARSLAAVAVSSTSAELDRNEQTSLSRLRSFLGDRDIFALRPLGAADRFHGLPVKHFPAECFRSLRAHQRLLMSPRFYEAFGDYEFVLIHHLDSLVLSDELDTWCAEGWDNVGAPWTRTGSGGSVVLTGVGNGGFALRRVSSCIRVARAARRPRERLRVRAWFARRLVSRALRRRDVTALWRAYLTEDKFWGELAPRLDATFRVAPAEVALGFAFETNPRACFELNGRRLPFGCHKWWHHDPEFWEPYLD
jgi:Protein of unknown function (DUF5672)